jgi:hypothetical protein
MSPSGYHFFPALKQNLADLKFKYDREAETIVARRLITQDMDFYQHGIEKILR